MFRWNDRAVAPDQVHVDALQIVFLLAVHRVEVGMEVIAGAEFERRNGIVTIAIAFDHRGTAQARNDGVVDLLRA